MKVDRPGLVEDKPFKHTGASTDKNWMHRKNKKPETPRRVPYRSRWPKCVSAGTCATFMSLGNILAAIRPVGAKAHPGSMNVAKSGPAGVWCLASVRYRRAFGIFAVTQRGRPHSRSPLPSIPCVFHDHPVHLFHPGRAGLPDRCGHSANSATFEIDKTKHMKTIARTLCLDCSEGFVPMGLSMTAGSE